MAPILISDKLDGNYANAIMQNHSSSGMYLICQQALGFDEGVYVNMLESARNEIYRGFFGRVKWCRELKRSDENDDHFGIGINFIVKSHNYFGGIGCMTDCCCDVCGEKTSFNKLIRTDDYVFQCKDCYNALNSFPEGNLKSCISNYLLGNIL